MGLAMVYIIFFPQNIDCYSLDPPIPHSPRGGSNKHQHFIVEHLFKFIIRSFILHAVYVIPLRILKQINVITLILVNCR